MPARHVTAHHARAPHHARRQRDRSVLRVVALTLSAVLLFGVSSAAALLQRLDSNIETIDVAGLLGNAPTAPASASAEPTRDPEDPAAGRALTILVLGSDQRDGENAAIGGEDPSMASDTTIVVHVSADRSRVELVSIPRDSLVDIPSCRASNGTTTQPAKRQMFNKAFSIGWNAGGDLASAAACAGRTVQQNTGLTIDHFVVVDFTGFMGMVNAIGGVDICIPQAMSDTYIPLNLQPGQQVLDGYQALQFARSRHNNVGNGGDLDRIGNQQRLIAAMVGQVLSRDVLLNPVKLTAFLSAATDSLTVDEGLNLVNLTGLGYSLRSVRSANITLMTIPVAAAPEDRNRLVWTSAASPVWANMAADQPIVAQPEPPVTDPSQPAATEPAPGETKQAGREPFTPADVTAVCA
jgi:LCP family protein required for cell wall assembly